MIDTPKELFAALQKTGDCIEITQSLYLNFMEVLTPKEIGTDFFIFQEGEGERLYFKVTDDKYFCHLLSDYLVTEDWEIHAAVSRNRIDAPFKVLFVFSDEETCEVPYEYENFIGKEYVSVSALAEAMNVTFRV